MFSEGVMAINDTGDLKQASTKEEEMKQEAMKREAEKRQKELDEFNKMASYIRWYEQGRKLDRREWRNLLTGEAYQPDSKTGPKDLGTITSGPEDQLKPISPGTYTYQKDDFSVILKNDGTLTLGRAPVHEAEFEAMWGRLLDFAVINQGATSVTLNFHEGKPWSKTHVKDFLRMAEDRGIAVEFGPSMQSFLDKLKKEDSNNIVSKAAAMVTKDYDFGYDEVMALKARTHDRAKVSALLKGQPFNEMTAALEKETKEKTPEEKEAFSKKTLNEKISLIEAEDARAAKLREKALKDIDTQLDAVKTVLGNEAHFQTSAGMGREVDGWGAVKSAAKRPFKALTHALGFKRDVYDALPVDKRLDLLKDAIGSDIKTLHDKLKDQVVSGSPSHNEKVKTIEEAISEIEKAIEEKNNSVMDLVESDKLQSLTDNHRALKANLEMLNKSTAFPDQIKETEGKIAAVEAQLQEQSQQRAALRDEVKALENKKTSLEIIKKKLEDKPVEKDTQKQILEQQQKIATLLKEIEEKKKSVAEFKPKNSNPG